jgi:hypothetical protein
LAQAPRRSRLTRQQQIPGLLGFRRRNTVQWPFSQIVL